MICRLLIVCIIAFSAWPAYAGQAPRVYGATFASTFTIYALSPDLLVGWNGPLRAYEKKYILEKYQTLPILGGWYGQGFFPDREVLMQAGIDQVLLLTNDTEFTAGVEKALKEIDLPVLTLRGLYLDDYPTMFRRLGQTFGMPERGDAMARFTEKTIAETKTMLGDIPEDKRLRVYLAQEVDGLGTVCDEANRSELLHLAGGINVHSCPQMTKESTTKISFEQIMAYDPDVVLIMHPSFVERFKEDHKWQNLRAAKEGRIYNVPYEPFCWMDKPSTYMRIIALPWLACTLYPERCTKDLVKETRDFMELFFHLDLDDAAIHSILNP